MVEIMVPSESRTVGIIWHTFPRLDPYSVYTDPEQHITTGDTACTVDDLNDLYDLDRDLSGA